ncbi:hypothetical protein [Litchfieldella xinjiangensis]|uniref:hypothetical protein n=1 Tax=Litchfieldella xinjiangensis TaxID=1166948 RepID=UPI0005BA0187|nr:hypothetical protein [Halomonas xinjiangensis]
MKHKNAHTHVDEREKLRKFRELDDAFAQALNELEGKPTPKPEAEPPMPSIEQDDELAARRKEREREALFERRVQALMEEYALPRESVATLMRTLLELGKIA